MRICLYTETALPRIGGQEMVIDALARRFQSAGNEVHVLAPRPRGQDYDDSQFPYPVHRHAPFYSTRRFLGWYARYLLKFLRRHAFDVLHCHSVYPTAYLASLVRAELGVPVVVTSHGGDVREGNSRMRKPGVRARHTQGVAAADALIAISRYTREGYERLAPGAGPIIEIPNGVDVATLARQVQRPSDLPAGITSGEFLLSLGRMHPQKGGDVLIKAFAQSLRNQQSNTQLVFAGGGPMRNAWEVLAREEGISNRCHFLGFVTGETKTWLLQNAIATVVPTRQWEAFGLAVIESYAAGRPVIASDLPGLGDLVIKAQARDAARAGLARQTGIAVPPDDPDALAKAITKLTTNRELADQLGRGAKLAAQQYDWPHVAAEHLRLYERLTQSERVLVA